jgi:predicted flavoprotein YhiN
MTEVAVIGAGPAGLMAAEVMASGGVNVTVYDAMASAGRKFLMAGRGGLNLTHSEALPQFLGRYGSAMPHLKAAIEAFPPGALREWSATLGQPTFVGSSGRVFPHAFKASPLLRAWLRRLDASGVNSRCGTAGSDGTQMDGWSSTHPRDRDRSIRVRPFWRSAVPAGRGSDLMAHGPGCWPHGASRSRRWYQPIAVSWSRGPTSSAIASKASR